MVVKLIVYNILHIQALPLYLAKVNLKSDFSSFLFLIIYRCGVVVGQISTCIHIIRIMHKWFQEKDDAQMLIN